MLLLLPVAFAATWIVDPSGTGDSTTIQGAIGLATSGDTVQVAPGTYAEDVDYQARSLSLVGRDGSTVTFIVGTGSGPAVQVASGEGPGTALSGFTISGGNATAYAASNYAGGGLYASNVPIALSDLVFTDNIATYGGGAYIGDAVGATVTGCSFEANTGTVAGGLYVLGGAVTIASTAFDDNVAGPGNGFGGAAVFYGTTLTGTDLSFAGNTATRSGGHVYATGGSFSCDHCAFSRGSAESGGGAYLSTTPTNLTTTTFSDNVATANGGGLDASDSAVTLARVDFTTNAATYGGAALLSNASLSGAHVSVASNAASGAGGGLYLSQSTLDVRNTSFLGNVASTSNGGAIALDTSQATISASLFELNDGYSGGAIHVNDGSSATIANVTATENSSSASAGGIRVTAAGALTLTSSIIAWSSDGSGISGATGATVSVSYGDLFENAGGPTSSGYADPTGLVGNLAVNPEFVNFADDGSMGDDLHLAPGSPMIDAGDPTVTDADGSPCDIGAYGGPNGADWDNDGDGWSAADGDCDDTNAAVHPDQADGCGNGDEDCDGATDEDCADDTGGDADTDTDSDSDTDADSDADTDTDADSDADTGSDDTGGGKTGCGCATGGSHTGALGVALGLLVVARRRR